ncbi:hypothetical protein CYMTET_23845, partial [Cymbomonas tetramitiformis]
AGNEMKSFVVESVSRRNPFICKTESEVVGWSNLRKVIQRNISRRKSEKSAENVLPVEKQVGVGASIIKYWSKLPFIRQGKRTAYAKMMARVKASTTIKYFQTVQLRFASFSKSVTASHHFQNALTIAILINTCLLMLDHYKAPRLGSVGYEVWKGWGGELGWESGVSMRGGEGMGRRGPEGGYGMGEGLWLCPVWYPLLAEYCLFEGVGGLVCGFGSFMSDAFGLFTRPRAGDRQPSCAGTGMSGSSAGDGP